MKNTKFINLITGLAITLGIANTANAQWSTSGNSISSGNFLGTTNGFALEFKVDGNKSGWIDYASPYNTTLGYEALNSLSTGANNTAIGYQAGNSITSGLDNTILGYQTGNSITSGNSNIVIGYQSLYANTTGGGNVAIGLEALYTMSGENYNVGVGHQALYSLTTGANNTAIGSFAGYYSTTGSNNILLGYKADAAGYSNSIVLGYQASATASNQMVLGTTSITQTLLNGNVGIGTTSPSEKLDVKGADAAGTVAVLENSAYNVRFGADLSSGAYNYTTQATDNGIFWTDGLAPGYENLSSSFIIAPWQASHNGIRIDGASGNLIVNYQTTSAILGTCGEASALNYGNAYIGFNASRSSSGTWTAYGDGASSNGGAAIYGDIGGDLLFATMPKTGNSNQTASDANILTQSIMMITSGGKVVIGKPFAATSPLSTINVTTPGTYNLYVAGGILTEQVRVAVVNSGTWADYVFADGYKLKPLNEVEQYLKENKHLPEVPSSSDVQNTGIDVATMDATLLKKIEELTLYIIELQKENSKNAAQIQQLNDQLKVLSVKK